MLTKWVGDMLLGLCFWLLFVILLLYLIFG